MAVRLVIERPVEFRNMMSLNTMRECRRIEDYYGLVIEKEWKRVLGIINIQILMLVIV